MSSERDKPWVDKKGQTITFKDCKDAVHQAISCMTKEFASNKVLKDSQAMSIAYQRNIDVLEVVREKFDMLDKHTKKVQRKTVKKRKKLIH